ncbi:hypothetical protein J2X20_000616 [Pelomonas saccharophila]|uniref:Uncharacterized protein n=1 Tax=Roseateles saccharophilus TaxID=304 RepID=A0ABU1YGJ8_ROSSA|nr:hypothetical protein [Roseateles saccharophilus]MDR7267987.1 hypothetical protein [Roseateles saccharophilus]
MQASQAAWYASSGIQTAAGRDDNALELEFRFEVTDDGDKNFLLTYQSLDGRYAADSWHETLEEALASAEGAYGVAESEWVMPADARPRTPTP